MKKTALLFVMAAVINPAYALTLKIATLSPDGSGWMTKMRSGAAEIEQKTQQRVTFKFYTGGTMGNDRAVLNKIKIGQLQGGAVTARGKHLEQRKPVHGLDRRGPVREGCARGARGGPAAA